MQYICTICEGFNKISSGNVFSDIGIEESAEALAKSELARNIANIIKARNLTQIKAAKLLSIDQPKVSRLVRGQLKEFSIGTLLNFILEFDRDIEIVIAKRSHQRKRNRIGVRTAAA